MQRRRPGQSRPHGSRQFKSAVSHKHLTPALRLKLQREAAALGLTCEEYVRLVLALSRSLRSGLAGGQDAIDAKMLVKLVDNPLFSAMMQFITRSAASRMQSAEGADDGQSQAETAPSAPTQNSGSDSHSSPLPNGPRPQQLNPYELPRPIQPPQVQQEIPPWAYW